MGGCKTGAGGYGVLCWCNGGAWIALAKPSSFFVISLICDWMLFAICALVADSVLKVAALWLFVSPKCRKLEKYACSVSCVSGS